MIIPDVHATPEQTLVTFLVLRLKQEQLGKSVLCNVLLPHGVLGQRLQETARVTTSTLRVRARIALRDKWDL